MSSAPSVPSNDHHLSTLLAAALSRECQLGDALAQARAALADALADARAARAELAAKGPMEAFLQRLLADAQAELGASRAALADARAELAAERAAAQASLAAERQASACHADRVDRLAGEISELRQMTWGLVPSGMQSPPGYRSLSPCSAMSASGSPDAFCRTSPWAPVRSLAPPAKNDASNRKDLDSAFSSAHLTSSPPAALCCAAAPSPTGSETAAGVLLPAIFPIRDGPSPQGRAPAPRASPSHHHPMKAAPRPAAREAPAAVHAAPAPLMHAPPARRYSAALGTGCLI